MDRPKLNMGLTQRGEQQMLLQPRMLQSIEVLQLSSLDLEAYLQEAAQENEALNLEASPSELASAPVGTWADADAHDEMLRNQPDRAKSLADVVEEQLMTADFTPEVSSWVRFLIGCLDPSGYLSPDDETLMDLAADVGLQRDALCLARGVAALQSLEPCGIGARNAIEALILQLDPCGDDYAQLCELLENFVEDLASNRVPLVARALGVEISELERLIGSLSVLDPRPAGALVDGGAPVIVPDVLVEWTGDDFEVSVMASALPAASIDAEIAGLARDRDQSTQARQYLRGKVEQARWIVDALAHRGETLLRVAQAVFRHQRSFLEEGPGNLRPLRMNALAEQLELHVSTVSRAVAGKFAQTPWGILALRSFFQASTGAEQGADGSSSAARDDVRRMVARVFEEEDEARPLSDDEVVAELEQRGIRIARRTVAKYRKELDIPSSYRRRRFRDSQ
ncbi:MAG: RNA polymerase sigma-54 factor [Chlamydiales bacterium]|jgi:RNA polymerase sigma-54 factor